MQWQKAKTILIVVFLLINILLLSYLFYDNHSTDSRKFADLTAVLARNQVHLRMNALPNIEKELFVPEFSTPVISQKLAELFTENPIPLENGGYTNQSGTCRLEWVEGMFSYENQSPNHKKFKNLTQKNAVSKLKPFLKAMGIEEFLYPVDITEIQGETIVEFRYQIEEYKLFDSALTFTLTPSGIKRIRGFFGIPDSKNGFSYSLAPTETLLLSLGQKNEEHLEINQMEPGYYFLNYTDAMISQAIPVYRLTTSQGSILLDARDGVSPEERLLRQIR